MPDSNNEKRPLLRPVCDQQQDVQNGVYYDSFPSPSPELSQTINSADGDKVAVEGKDNSVIRVYKRRWYILVLFSLYSFTQNSVWNTWGPISTTAEDAFNWDDSDIAWFSNWGPISYIIVGLLFPWLLQKKGLRWAGLSSMFLVALGTACRVITSEPGAATMLIHVAQFLNGLAGPIAMGAFPTLSATWFAPKERVTATAVGSSISVFGMAVSFILGPALVSGGPPAVNMTNIQPHLHNITPWSDIVFNGSSPTDVRQSEERDEIMQYMYYVCGWSGAIFLLMLIYFPAKPPHPPCLSAMVERDKYWSGLWSLKGKIHFLIVATTYGVSTGVLGCWGSVLNLNLQTINVSEDKAGWLGFYSTVSACIASLALGRFADVFARYIKALLLILYIVGTACFVAFALLLLEVIPFSNAVLYTSIIGGNTLINAAIPLMYELACELAYPTSEGAANGILTYLNNIGGLIFLAIFFIPNLGSMWMNYVLIGSTAICIPLIVALKGRFKRLEVDEGVHPEIYVEQEYDVSVNS